MATSPTWVASPDQLASVPRNTVHAMIDGLIQWLDDQDGDADMEEADLEDSFALSWYARGKGPGCPVADPGEPAYTEWQTRGSRKDFGGYEVPTNLYLDAIAEDAEDDEGGGDTGQDEGEPDFSRQPRGDGPGCIISDPDRGVDDDPEGADEGV